MRAGETATGWPSGVGLVRLAEIGSTSAEAFRLAAAGGAGRLWVTAACQTAGRGRSGRKWLSEHGNLYASHLLWPEAVPSTLHQLAFVAGVAVHETVTRALAEAEHAGDLRLKWPNDLLLDGAKLGGILTEASTQGQRTCAVIGIGLNVCHQPAISGRATTSLAAAGVATSPGRLLPVLANALDRWLTIWHEGSGFAAIRAAWTEHGPPPGQRLTVSDGDHSASSPSPKRRQGRFAGLDGDGALLLADDHGEISRVTYGDVTLGWMEGDRG
ncbi:MAG: biotin--[acetyl-CoA-carboxylase] ligase [Hyphomicrobiaceae bacterium]